MDGTTAERRSNLPAELSMMLDRILDFPNRDVEHAMIPRPRVGTVTTTGTAVLNARSGYSQLGWSWATLERSMSASGE